MNRWNCQHDRGALSRKARGAGRRAGVLGWRAGLACWAGVLGWALRAGRCGGYGRRTYGFFSSLLHQFHAEVRRPSMQLPAS